MVYYIAFSNITKNYRQWLIGYKIDKKFRRHITRIYVIMSHNEVAKDTISA